jgi:hypothetical protein
MFRRSYLYLFIALLLTGLLILYRYLGGFTKPQIDYFNQQEYRIGGVYYEGSITAPEWEALFYRMTELVGTDSVKGDLAIVWYNEPELEKGIARAFIGIRFEGNVLLPSDMEIRKIIMNGVVRATLQSHVLVIPRPVKIARQIRSWAEEHNLQLQDILIEIYPEESIIHAEIPVKPDLKEM